MIADAAEIKLTPGNKGEDCLGNGKYFDEYGNTIKCCCDECNYLMCCVSECDCENCNDIRCERNKK